MNLEKNKATIKGEIVGEVVFDHEVFGERFYTTAVDVIRTSGTHDIIPVMISERLIDVENDYMNLFVNISGQFRSFNRRENEKSRLILHLFVQEIFFVDELEEFENVNEIYLDGYICKEPGFRRTPMGREISDVLLAVNRYYGKTDYIPCVFWGRNAHYAAGLKVGANLQINGRIQSREYLKKIIDNSFEKRIAYEVSVGRMKVKND